WRRFGRPYPDGAACMIWGRCSPSSPKSVPRPCYFESRSLVRSIPRLSTRDGRKSISDSRPLIASVPMSHRPRLQSTESSVGPTRAEVELDALAHNLAVMRQAAGPARVFCVVKADAYGHGVVPVVERLAAEGASGFGVALAEEGLE